MPNTSAIQSTARSPRAIIRIGGVPVDGWIEWSVTNNTYFEADTFSASFATSRLPSAFDAQWFSQQTEIFIEILAGFPSDPAHPSAGELTSLIYGRVDDLHMDLSQTTIALTGRDLTGAFIDSTLTTQYSNRTASQIVGAICAEHGIKAEITTTEAIVGSPALANVGTYSLRSTVHMTTSNSEWDLISWLARESGFVAYFQGQTFFFGADPTPTATPYEVFYSPSKNGGPPSSNAQSIELSRSFTVAKGIEVTAQSASFLGPTITRSYPQAIRTIKPGKASPYGPTQQYFVSLPAGKNAQQVEAAAEAAYRERISHAMKMHGEFPGVVELNVRMPIRVQGTRTAFDQLFYPRSIERRMSMEEGFEMEVDAQNSTPALEALLEAAGGS